MIGTATARERDRSAGTATAASRAVVRARRTQNFGLPTFVLLLVTLLAASPAKLGGQNTATTSGVQATTVPLESPASVAYDTSGNLYVALRDDHLVRRIDTLGVITTVAGTGQQGFSGDGGSATAAQLDTPVGIAFDTAGNLYIADSHNQRIRAVNTAGIISTIAGTGTAGFTGDNGPATAAQLYLPVAVSVDSTGAVYVADSANQRIRKVSASGTITTVAGTGEEGFSGDAGPATAAQLDFPSGVLADPNTPGAFTISDRRNQRLRAVSASGIISTLAGTGVADTGGDNGPAISASLAGPRGLAIDPTTGTVYIADTDNHRIRAITAGQITTVAGAGVQGFFGDLGDPRAAYFDSPRGPAFSRAVLPTGLLAIADTHNERVRASDGSTVTTVAGIAPAAAEGLLLFGPTTGVYGTSIGTLAVTFSNVGKTATGNVTLMDGTASLATAVLSANTAIFSLNGLSAGKHDLTVVYAGDAANPSIASGVYVVNITAAGQVINFATIPAPGAYQPGLTSTLSATATSGLPVTFSVASGPATVSGNTLTYTGAGTVSVTASQAGGGNYAPATPVTQSVTVGPQISQSGSVTLTGLSPSVVPFGATGVQLTVTGANFTAASVVQLNGSSLSTTFINASTLTAMVPVFSALGTQQVTVTGATSFLPINVTTISAPATVSVPGTVGSAQQTAVGLQLATPLQVPLTGTLTLTFAPAAGLTTDDSAIQFSTGGRIVNFTVPANSTSVPAVSLQTGTVAGTITLTLSLTSYGVDVTPAAARVSVINIPEQVPSVTVTFAQSGSTITVSALGFSNVRNMSQAAFKFTPAPGTTLATDSDTLQVSDIFNAGWFNTAASSAYGSSFLYTQTFQLGDSSAKIAAVTLVLTNSVGDSPAASTQ